MKIIDTITFFDGENDSNATVIVRSDELHIGLCLSLETNGDLEVFIPKKDAQRIVEALMKATSR